MAFDGIFLCAVAEELEKTLIGGKVDKISQPAGDLIILSFRNIGRNDRLLISVNPSFPRVHITKTAFENPQKPPMFCTILRKHLTSAQLCGINMYGFERVLELVFKVYDELGDLRTKKLIIEIMGRHSNAVLVDDGGFVIDSAKKVDASVSSVRQILPHIKYEYPPKQYKTDITKSSDLDTSDLDTSEDCDTPLHKVLLNTFQGFSPLIAREISFLATGSAAAEISCLKNKEISDKLRYRLSKLGEKVAKRDFTPIIIKDATTGEPIDFSYMNIAKDGIAILTETHDSFGELLDEFYSKREKSENIKKKTLDLLRLLSNNESRLIKKISLQKDEICKAQDSDRLKKFGDLLTANLYRISRGAAASVEDYFEENNPIEIPMDESLTPLANAKKYYSDYKKSKTATVALAREVEIAENDLVYINSVLDSLTKVETEAEIDEIRNELRESGYIKRPDRKRSKMPPSKPMSFLTDDGYTVLVGKNNVQNDRLTLKTAGKLDVWCHVKDYPGSHAVVVSKDGKVSDNAVVTACEIAAIFSKVGDGSNIAVDYTLVKNVKKPMGSKPGMVIYTDQSTLYVSTNKDKIEKMKIQ